jgi:hypothetical protein
VKEERKVGTIVKEETTVGKEPVMRQQVVERGKQNMRLARKGREGKEDENTTFAAFRPARDHFRDGYRSAHARAK